LTRKFRFGTLPAGNPLANALTLVVGALAVGAAIVLGFFAFVILAGIVVMLASIVGIRLWWLNRQLRRNHSTQEEARRNEDGTTRVIEGEYRVVSTQKDGSSRRGAPP
jgi:membrane protein implicated in regulation of membrane protease activity